MEGPITRWGEPGQGGCVCITRDREMKRQGLRERGGRGCVAACMAYDAGRWRDKD